MIKMHSAYVQSTDVVQFTLSVWLFDALLKRISACVAPTRAYIMSRVMRKPAFCICENKDADQLRGNREADQRHCFRYIDSTIPLLSKSEISNL